MTVFILIFFLLLLLYGYLINRYSRSWEALPNYQPFDTPAGIKLSVIIAARNEEQNIQALIESLNAQTYPQSLFEVLIVNDFSTDNTWATLSKYQNLNFTFTPIDMSTVEGIVSPNDSSKKKAIGVAVSKAKGEVIVTTDADCIHHPDWLGTIARFYHEMNAYCVAGPVRIESNKTFISIFQSLDFLTLQGITGGAIQGRMHMMANGANFSYRKDIFDEVEGFSDIDSVPSGDDILLMEKINIKYPHKMYYLKNPSVIVSTSALGSWKEFLQQRIRWAGKSNMYKDKRIIRTMTFVWLFNTCFLVLAIICFVKPYYLFLLVLFIGAKILIDYPFVNEVAAFFNQKRLMRLFPLMQPVHILYTIVMGFLGMVGNYTWKGRTINKA